MCLPADENRAIDVIERMLLAAERAGPSGYPAGELPGQRPRLKLEEILLVADKVMVW